MKRLFISLMSVILLVAIPSNSVYATTNANDEGLYNIPVTAEIIPVFTVKLPNSIHISERGVKEFDIIAEGTPKRSETLIITMSDTISMVQGDKTIEMEVSIDKTHFYYNEMTVESGTTTKCRIDASSLLSGSWSGDLVVDIKLKDYEIPDGLSLRPLIVAYRDKSNRCHIVAVETEHALTYNKGTGYIGYTGNGIGSAVQYHEDANGDYQGGSYDRIWGEVIHVPNVDLIYSNYDIKYSDSNEVFFAKTTFS